MKMELPECSETSAIKFGRRAITQKNNTADYSIVKLTSTERERLFYNDRLSISVFLDIRECFKACVTYWRAEVHEER